MPRRKKELLDLLKRKKQVARSSRPPTVRPAPVPSQGSRKKSAPLLVERLKGLPLFGWLPVAVVLVLSVLVLDWLFGDCQGPIRDSTPPALSSSVPFSILVETYDISERERAERAAAALVELLDSDGDGSPPVQLLSPLEYPKLLEVYVGLSSSKEGLQNLKVKVQGLSIPSEPKPYPFEKAYIRASHRLH